MSLSLDDAKEAKDEAQQSGLRDNDAGIQEQFDYQQHDAPIVRGHPECLISFDRIAGFDVFNTQDNFLDRRQNLDNPSDSTDYGNQVVLTLEGPELVEGQLWAEDHGFRDYRVVGDIDSDYSPYSRDTDTTMEGGEVTDVEVTGVDLGMGGFDGEEADSDLSEFDYIQVFISSSRATQVLGALDTAGKWATTSEGNVTEGIIEVPPEFGTEDYDAETHGAPRAIGYPELRADMVGQTGAISWTFDSDDPSRTSRIDIDFYTVEDGALEAALRPLTTDDEAYAKPTYPRLGNFYWEVQADEQDMGADVEPESNGGVAEAKAMMNGSDVEETTFDDLNDTAQEFVEDAVDALSGEFESVGELDDWDDRYAQFAADIDSTQSEVASIIDGRL